MREEEFGSCRINHAVLPSCNTGHWGKSQGKSNEQQQFALRQDCRMSSSLSTPRKRWYKFCSLRRGDLHISKQQKFSCGYTIETGTPRKLIFLAVVERSSWFKFYLTTLPDATSLTKLSAAKHLSSTLLLVSLSPLMNPIRKQTHILLICRFTFCLCIFAYIVKCNSIPVLLVIFDWSLGLILV